MKNWLKLKNNQSLKLNYKFNPRRLLQPPIWVACQEEVRPLELTTRLTASGLHEAEFRGTKFIQEQKNNSTIELFRVNDENIIKSFIKKQTDRSKLFYIRLSGEGQAEQYVMLYGSFGNKRDAAQT